MYPEKIWRCYHFD